MHLGSVSRITRVCLVLGAVVVPCVGAPTVAPTVLAQSEPLAAEEAAGKRVPELKLSARSLAMLDEPVAHTQAVETIKAGKIPRAALRAELERGIGAFLRHVHAKAAIVRGRFAGWRVVELFRKRPEIHVRQLRSGDTVTRVNGRSLERPEQLKYVWESLATAPELVIEVERDSRRRELHYAIVD